ncbi:pyridoxine/pyridoxamine 5'-phosphate oxidase-like [Macrosteles quadrilineatus]|uniref:pyridoxine/pyridoxamine 5'-phosphate oxidase-like n=1 Tax=Macrosteles quadrilineatus TaxID=74068 RepID=UPI0023E19705|nr:pyridoxine/pyridoxamine 5'-phosphate oxidase-like [Macrosteles quadrilineatus]
MRTEQRSQPEAEIPYKGAMVPTGLDEEKLLKRGTYFNVWIFFTNSGNSLESRVYRAVVFLSTRLQSTSAIPQTTVPETKEPTGLHHLKSDYATPFGLFKEWYREHQHPNKVVSNALTFSTSNKAGKLSSRTLILRRLDDDGFVIMTDKRSKKCKDLEENPYASMVFLWLSMHDSSLLSRQVRAEGPVHQLVPEDMEELYQVEPLFCKIRAHICHQGQPVDWHKHKDNHDKVLAEWERGVHDLARPDHVVAYKLVPEGVEFYEALGLTIGDRLLYEKAGKEDWKITRIAA